jgi:phage-related protein
MSNTTSRFQAWSATQTYGRYDIAWGISANDPRYLYSVHEANLGNHPYADYSFAIASHARSNDTATVTFTSTGTPPRFGVGSLVQIVDTTDPTFAHTGMVMEAGAGYVKYVSPGYDVAATSAVTGTVAAPISPAWTTGFMFIPSYNSPLEGQQGVISAKFEGGYEQRQPTSINSNTDTWSLNFNDRSDKEARAIYHYVQEKLGTYPVRLMLPVSKLVNTPDQKFVLGNPRVSPKGYDMNDVSVMAREVFDL